MNPRTILYPLRVEQPIDELGAAITLCGQIGAHLSVVLIGFEPSPPVGADSVILSDSWGGHTESIKRQLRTRGKEVEQHLLDSGVSAEIKRWLMVEDSVEAGIAEHALFADVAFIPRTLPNDRGFARRIAAGVLFRSGKPIVVAEPEQFGSLSWKTVVVGWDNEKTAARAIAEAMPMLSRAEDVHVLCVDPGSMVHRAVEAPGWDLATYLSRHDVTTTVHTQPSGGRPISDVLTDFAKDVGADGLVAGAYGHSRLRQRLLGGTTRSLIESGTLPLLMAH